MDPGAQEKWLILQKCFQLGPWLFLVPLERCMYWTSMSKASYWSWANRLRAWWGCRWLSASKFSSFAVENVALLSSPTQENKSSASNDYPASRVTAPSHALACSLCFRVDARVGFHDTSRLIYTMRRCLMYCRPLWRAGSQPWRRVTITPTTFPHVCEAGGLWAAFLLLTQSSLIKSHHWMCSSALALWLQFTQKGDDGSAISSNAQLCHSSHELWIIRKPPVVCSCTSHKDVGQRSCFLWCLCELSFAFV